MDILYKNMSNSEQYTQVTILLIQANKNNLC